MAELSGKPPMKLAEPPFIKGKPGKKRKFSPDPEQEENDRNVVRFHIGGERYVYVKRFKGHVYVNLREYYFNEDKTKLLPGKKGLNLTAEEWMNLSDRSKAINEAIDMV
ncbi:activated RNA polymerase II transcriptional coactivator p15-like [Patiria miniata]|uniref:Transcriptional coactivator p15 (PC4) C-terminal domain-containing protein n=1 Tax=Patiria miniata TaxID=46514 RepID=A0A914AWE3_PATMI|nr:activated RNA polymerase II transcriptional coactivator p15-like [Patiria miniata]